MDGLKDKLLSILEDEGRGGDTYLGHLSHGEIVIPPEFARDRVLRDILTRWFRENGVDINEFIVGHPMNKINPETGYPEFFLKKLFKAIGGLFAPDMPKPVVAPPAPAPTPVEDDEELRRARARAQMAAQSRSGRAATMLTGFTANNSGGRETLG